LSNPARKGIDDMGRVYGVQGRSWQKPDGTSIDQLKKIVDNLKRGVDDRGEILTFYNPGEFDLGCLRPCMHTHTFSLLGDVLHLTSYQRSCDVPLGLNFNQIQVFTLLALVAQITGNSAGLAYHKIVNAHIYEDQLELMRDVQLRREPFDPPQLHINPDIKSLEDIETWVTLKDFEVDGYEHHDPIAYPFSV
jgi:thymidylate synthase